MLQQIYENRLGEVKQDWLMLVKVQLGKVFGFDRGVVTNIKNNCIVIVKIWYILIHY